MTAKKLGKVIIFPYAHWHKFPSQKEVRTQLKQSDVLNIEHPTKKRKWLRALKYNVLSKLGVDLFLFEKTRQHPTVVAFRKSGREALRGIGKTIELERGISKNRHCVTSPIHERTEEDLKQLKANVSNGKVVGILRGYGHLPLLVERLKQERMPYKIIPLGGVLFDQNRRPVGKIATHEYVLSYYGTKDDLVKASDKILAHYPKMKEYPTALHQLSRLICEQRELKKFEDHWIFEAASKKWIKLKDLKGA